MAVKLRSSTILTFIIYIEIIHGTLMNKHETIPKLTGAKLIGIFDDDPNKLLKTLNPINESSSFHNNLIHSKLNNNDKLYYCEEAIFDGESVSMVRTSKPRCRLGSEHDHHSTRYKRSATLSNLPKLISIPAPHKETIQDGSYIKARIRVCSMPGGVALVFDQVTGKVLSGFRNGGASYHCNQWMEPNAEDTNKGFKQFISDSNQIQIEFQLPTSDEYVQSEVRSTFIQPNKHSKRHHGERRIWYKANKDDIDPIFQLDVQYEEIVFQYEDEKHDGPEILTTGLAGAAQEYGPLKYRPNWVKTIVLDRRSLCDNSNITETNCQDKFFIGLTIEIQHLDLDFDRGDYLLVGPGDRPEFWKNSKGQMITQRIDENNVAEHKKIWVNTDSAFLRLVTHNSLFDLETRSSPALKFKWKPGDTKMDDLELSDVSQLLKEASIQLCFTGYECNYYRNVERLFLDEAVHIFNRYLINNEKSITTLITRDSVKVFDVEPISYVKGHYTEQYCQFNLAIASPYDNEYPLVPSDVLYRMFFGDAHTSSVMMIHSQIEVNNCVFQRISWLSVLLPIGIILLLSIAIMALFWRIQNKLLHRAKTINTNTRNQINESIAQKEPLQAGEFHINDAMQY
ncbi:hypothetical protein BLOT_001050 [Blomia tropicalis]|nr:hypothetical protein BLOT_001050 [Blomia tropicalis]